VAWQDVEGEIVILDGAGKKILGLNRTGGLVWKLLDGQRTLKEVAAQIAREFRVTDAQAQADTLAFAKTLIERGLATNRPR
jgi:hypothetical protein